MYIYRAHPDLTSLFSRALGDVRVSNCGHVRTPTRTLHLALARAFYLSRARARAGTRRCRWIESRIRTAQKQWAWRIKSFPCQCQLQPIHLRVPLFGSDCSHKWMGRFSCVHALYLCARLFSPPNLTGNFYGGFFISDWYTFDIPPTHVTKPNLSSHWYRRIETIESKVLRVAVGNFLDM